VTSLSTTNKRTFLDLPRLFVFAGFPVFERLAVKQTGKTLFVFFTCTNKTRKKKAVTSHRTPNLQVNKRKPG
jgi:hypothetical protein